MPSFKQNDQLLLLHESVFQSTHPLSQHPLHPLHSLSDLLPLLLSMLRLLDKLSDLLLWIELPSLNCGSFLRGAGCLTSV